MNKKHCVSAYISNVFFVISLSLFLSGCWIADDKVDHSVEIQNVGKREIIDFEYVYGDLGLRNGKFLGLGGDGVAAPMKIPEFVDVAWTTKDDGKRHEAHIPLKQLLHRDGLRNKIVSIQLNGDRVSIYIVTRLPDFQKESRKIYEEVT